MIFHENSQRFLMLVIVIIILEYIVDKVFVQLNDKTIGILLEY